MPNGVGYSPGGGCVCRTLEAPLALSGPVREFPSVRNPVTMPGCAAITANAVEATAQPAYVKLVRPTSPEGVATAKPYPLAAPLGAAGEGAKPPPSPAP
jgi:hypothetical protein